MKNIKVLGLAIAASVIAAPAFAGETYVRNEWTKTDGYTKTNLHLNSESTSVREESYDAFADKIYIDGGLDANYGKKGKGVDFDEFSVHTAGSSLWGNSVDTNITYVKGDINSYLETQSNAHETSAGVR